MLAFLLVFGLVGGWILAGRMLAPLTRITDATRMAATGSLSHRIRLPGRSDEFRELADAFDAMLARLEAHVAEQQRFAANASHELRTPLAITQTLLDVARNDPSRDTDELVDRLHAVNTRAIDLTEALLLLSRADQRSFARERVDLSLVAEEATETLLPLAEKRGVTIETSGDATPTVGSPALLLQLTTNLVHNAIVHNLPEHGTVWVTTSVHPETRGAHRREHRRDAHARSWSATLTEPFQRGTERIRTDHAGVPGDRFDDAVASASTSSAPSAMTRERETVPIVPATNSVWAEQEQRHAAEGQQREARRRVVVRVGDRRRRRRRSRSGRARSGPASSGRAGRSMPASSAASAASAPIRSARSK